MINKGKDLISGQDTSTEDLFSDEQTDRRVRLHLTDISDVITEEDINNVRTDFDPEITEENSPVHTDDALTGGEEVSPGKKEIEQKEEEHPIITPWNVLGS